MTLFAMFSHLGLLLCLCWTMAFVAIYDGDDAFWYPFIAFNSLQVGKIILIQSHNYRVRLTRV